MAFEMVPFIIQKIVPKRVTEGGGFSFLSMYKTFALKMISTWFHTFSNVKNAMKIETKIKGIFNFLRPPFCSSTAKETLVTQQRLNPNA